MAPPETDPRAGQITLTEWVNTWFPALDLELNTLSTYRYTIEVHILPAFGERSLARSHRRRSPSGRSRSPPAAIRAALLAKRALATILGDAIPRHLQLNPAARRRGKGRKGQRRIERAEKAGNAWATALEALLFAERCSALSGADTDFVMMITMAYTGMRWSEAVGLPPNASAAT